MVPQQTQSEARAIVQSWIGQRKPFSAWDVTVELRKRGHSGEHHQLKSIPHDMFSNGEMGDFSKTLVQYQGAPRPAFLYHPPEVDPQTIVASTGGSVADATVASPVAPTTSVSDDDEDEEEEDEEGDDDDGDEEDEDDEEGTVTNPGSVVKTPGTVLYVPKSMAQAVGITPRGKAYMRIDSGKIVITPIPDANTKTVHVDCHQNIRVPTTALLKVGADDKVSLQVNGTEITVKRAG
jgi:hypothetical protein